MRRSVPSYLLPVMRARESRIEGARQIDRFSMMQIGPYTEAYWPLFDLICSFTSSIVKGSLLLWIMRWQFGHTGRRSRTGSILYSRRISERGMRWCTWILSLLETKSGSQEDRSLGKKNQSTPLFLASCLRMIQARTKFGAIRGACHELSCFSA